MFLQLRNRDPFFSSLNEYNRLRREMDDVLTPAMYVLQHMHPHVVAPKHHQGDKNKFEVKLDVQNFAPEELNVKMVEKFVVIEGKHEEKEDEQGYISRQFQRRYLLPDDVNPETISVNLSSDGLLTISAPRMIEQPKQSEKSLPINFTGQPALQAQKGSGDAASAENKENPTAKTN